MPRPLVARASRFSRLLTGAAIFLAAGLLASCNEQEPAAPPTNTVTGSVELPVGTGFDFWVLSLSWSPSYCEIEGDNANRQQCAAGRRLGFVVHGLWPQFEDGWPEFCDSDEPDRAPDSLVRDYLDVIPSAGLIGHQWRKHGSCSGLSQRDYLATTRAAWRRVNMPTVFIDPVADVRIAPDSVETHFLEANSGLDAGGIAVKCEAGFVDEVRICLSQSLEFRVCADVDRRACRAASADMPAPDG